MIPIRSTTESIVLCVGRFNGSSMRFMNKVAEGIKPQIYPRDQHTLSRSKIDPDALKIMYRLTRHGYKAYLVGGGVRDVLLGKQPKDFDIATDATPRQVKSLFRNSRIIGRRFKLVHIFFNSGKLIEVSTFRDNTPSPEIDEEASDTPQLAEDNVFGTEATDAVRRDLTINGLFYDASTFSIIDYVGGIEDLNNGLVRIIGDPEARFNEDPVRLIRVVRHAARNHFQIESKCYESLLRNVHLIKSASQVRVFEEVKRDLVCGAILPILRLLNKTGLLAFLLPALASGGDGLLSDGSHLPICLERIDSLIQSGKSVTATVVLAVLTLYSPLREGELNGDFFSSVSGFDDIEEQVHLAFSVLTVPRKEKERVTNLLWSWMKIQKTGVIRNRRAVEASDIQNLAYALMGDASDELLHEAEQHVNQRGARSSRRRRPRAPRNRVGG